MTKFELERINAIEGRQIFEKLVIDGICPFNDFEKYFSKNSKLSFELAMIYRYMEVLANGGSLPSAKFKDITPEKEKIKEYEFKSKNLRVYAIKKRNRKILIIGGFKNRQKRDIRKFRHIKKRFLKG